MPLKRKEDSTQTHSKERKTVSYSRLIEFNKCKRKFYYQYVAKLKGEDTVQEPLIKGSLAHYLVELKLGGGEDILTNLMLVLPKWIEECNLVIAETVDEMRCGGGIYLPSLADYADRTSDLLYRCSEKYTGADAIRKKDGTCPKDPLEYPPKAFELEYDKQYLHEHRRAIDVAAMRLNKDFTHISLANIAAQAVFYAKLFAVPEGVKTVAVEYPLEPAEDVRLKPISFDGDKIWTGFIDWIFETPDGKLVICDHKTSKEPPSGSDILWHAQLNLYVALYYEQTGRLADFIGISHLPSGTISLATADPVAATDIMKGFEEIQKSVNALLCADDESVFNRQPPTAYQSPCVRVDYKTKKKSVCPYLQHCWPNYYEDIQSELVS